MVEGQKQDIWKLWRDINKIIAKGHWKAVKLLQTVEKQPHLLQEICADGRSHNAEIINCIRLKIYFYELSEPRTIIIAQGPRVSKAFKNRVALQDAVFDASFEGRLSSHFGHFSEISHDELCGFRFAWQRWGRNEEKAVTIKSNISKADNDVSISEIYLKQEICCYGIDCLGSNIDCIG